MFVCNLVLVCYVYICTYMRAGVRVCWCKHAHVLKCVHGNARSISELHPRLFVGSPFVYVDQSRILCVCMYVCVKIDDQNLARRTHTQ